MLFVWLVCATVPAALTIPVGSQWAQSPRVLPTPMVLFDSSVPDQPISNSVLSAHPDSRHAALAMVPWILLSGLGFATLIDLASRTRILRAAAVGLLVGGVIFSGVRFVDSYFRDYPIVAAPFFSCGMDKVVDAVQQFNNGQGPAVITSRPEMPYIFVLFFGRYNPKQFQRDSVSYGAAASPPPVNLFAPVTGFDRYMYVDPNWGFSLFEHGIFVFATKEPPPIPPALTIHYPDGSIAYNVVTK